MPALGLKRFQIPPSPPMKTPGIPGVFCIPGAFVVHFWCMFRGRVTSHLGYAMPLAVTQHAESPSGYRRWPTAPVDEHNSPVRVRNVCVAAEADLLPARFQGSQGVGPVPRKALPSALTDELAMTWVPPFNLSSATTDGISRSNGFRVSRWPEADMVLWPLLAK